MAASGGTSVVPAGEAAPPAAGAAVLGWLWFMDGACLDWIERHDLRRDELRGLLLGALVGALMASGSGPLVRALTQP
jgi:hypothetical protein